MKIKIIAGLIVIAVMLSGIMVGCGPAAPEEEEEGITPTKLELMQISVGDMTLSIPTSKTWEHMRGDFLSLGKAASPETMKIDGYYERWKDAFVYMGYLDKEQEAEAQGASWEGWEAALEAEGKTKEQYTEELGNAWLADVKELQRTGQTELTIQGNEALQLEYSGLKHDEPAYIFTVAIFDDNDVGLLVAIADIEAWDKNEEAWYTIRDSVQLP